jgi:hypothetical protein
MAPLASGQQTGGLIVLCHTGVAALLLGHVL